MLEFADTPNHPPRGVEYNRDDLPAGRGIEGREVNVSDRPTAPMPTRGARPDCPGWCRDHLDDRENGGADLHQARLGSAGRLRVDVWQEVGGSITVELQIPGASAELLSGQEAMALAELLRRAVIVSDPG
jgi:hypothetical protein